MKLCPICTAVAGTWISLLVYRAAGYAVDPAILGTLMGGSVVGIAYQLDRRLPARRSGIWFKMLFIPVGFAAAYAIVSGYWGLGVAGALIATCIASAFLRKSVSGREHPEIVREAEKKLEQCC